MARGKALLIRAEEKLGIPINKIKDEQKIATEAINALLQKKMNAECRNNALSLTDRDKIIEILKYYKPLITMKLRKKLSANNIFCDNQLSEYLQ